MTFFETEWKDNERRPQKVKGMDSAVPVRVRNERGLSR